MTSGMKRDDFAEVFRRFQTSVSRFDCGRFCSPLNEGEPVCCDIGHAVPILDKAEYRHLRSRSDLWGPFKPKDSIDRAIVADMHEDCTAAACKGARHCERDNRSLACRSFPFYPYITREKEFVGLATYWTFADRCWLINNMQVVERQFVKEFVAAHEYIFARDKGDWDAMKSQSADHRRVFTRKNRVIPLIGRLGGFFKIMPRTAEIRPARIEDFAKIGPYKSPGAYAKAVAKAGGTPPEKSPFLETTGAASRSRRAAANR